MENNNSSSMTLREYKDIRYKSYLRGLLIGLIVGAVGVYMYINARVADEAKATNYYAQALTLCQHNK